MQLVYAHSAADPPVKHLYIARVTLDWFLDVDFRVMRMTLDP